MTEWVADYAWRRPDPQKMKEAGLIGVCRYLSHDKSGKTLSGPEAKLLLDHGLVIVLNFEDSAGRPMRGYDAGLADGAFANALAEQIGAPRTAAIYYSCDTDPGSPPNPGIIDYFRGVNRAGPRPVGVYGGAVLVRALLAAKLATFGWTANAHSWDHGVPPQGHLHQVYGHPTGSPIIGGSALGDYDVSQVLAKPFGAWGQAATVDPHGSDDEMYLIRDKVSGAEYATDFITKRHLKSADEVAVAQLALATRGLPVEPIQLAPEQAACIPDYVAPGAPSPIDVSGLADAVANTLANRLKA